MRRTGLAISVSGDRGQIETGLHEAIKKYQHDKEPIHLAHKELNDHIVRMALKFGAANNMPG